MAPLSQAEPVVRLPVRAQADVERARREARGLARTLRFGEEDRERIALATAELATNLVRYAREGELVLAAIEDGAGGWGIQVESRDAGPGIPDVQRVLEDGFSSGGGLGGGLPGVRRLMHEFSITSDRHGTHVVGRRWLPRR